MDKNSLKIQDSLKLELKALLKKPENNRCADCNTQGILIVIP